MTAVGGERILLPQPTDQLGAKVKRFAPHREYLRRLGYASVTLGFVLEPLIRIERPATATEFCSHRRDTTGGKQDVDGAGRGERPMGDMTVAKDFELRGDVLQKYNDARMQKGTIQLRALIDDTIGADTAFVIQTQISEHGPIEWQPIENSHIRMGMGRITASGVDVIKAERSRPLRFPLAITVWYWPKLDTRPPERHCGGVVSDESCCAAARSVGAGLSKEAPISARRVTNFIATGDR